MSSPELKPISWDTKLNCVSVIDQTILPEELKFVTICDHYMMADAIKQMLVRGAPLIGISGAFGLVLAIKNNEDFDQAYKTLIETRPTAVNLKWALDEMKAVYERLKVEDKNKDEIFNALLAKATEILEDDKNRCIQMSEKAADYIEKLFEDKLNKGEGLRVMTHCNAGALATAGYGTALGVIRTLQKRGLLHMVFANETRPRMQGSRLTVWELSYDNIPVTLNCDNSVAYLMQSSSIDLVVVGADRITANGDVANKIGTSQVAIMAEHFDIPLIVAAPESTIDRNLESGKEIPIEFRSANEISHINGKSCTVDDKQKDYGNVEYFNPAFDVSPNELIHKIFTENGEFMTENYQKDKNLALSKS